MIVRIATEGQYRLSSALLDELNEMDNALVDQIAQYDEGEFRARFTALLALVREQGEKVADEELVESHVILPNPDISVEEAREFFTGEGLFPESV
ncbi:MAG TPA: hypothetical protein VF707_18315 [Ardenticatenaceae bacterium]|jgi:hypothetical protein